METQNITDSKPELNSMENDQIAHLAGFFDAVGNITIRVVKNSNYSLNYTLHSMLEVYRPSDDDPILGKLLAYCDENEVRYGISEQSHGAERDSTSVKWTVKEPDSVEQFLQPMMDYLVSKFFEAELMLTQILPAIRNGDHRERQGFYELMGLSDELIRRSTSNKKESKYTQEYFKDEWSITE